MGNLYFSYKTFQKLFILFVGLSINFQTGFAQLALQNFSSASGTTPPAGWSNVANPGTTDLTQKWEFDNTLDGVSGGGFSGNYAVLNSDNYGSGFTQNATLTSPVFSCVGLTSVNIQFSEQFRSFGGSQAEVDLSIDGGTTWTNVATRISNLGYPNPASQSLIPISAANNQSNVRIRFTYIGTFGFWWSIDNVQVLQKIPTNITSTPSGGNWSVGTTWVGGIVPSSIDNVTIANGATVTIDTSPIVNNLTVGQGTSGNLGFDALSNARTLTVNGNLSIANNATFIPANGSIGRFVSLLGNLNNAGTTDFSRTNSALILRGTTPQSINLSGSGTFLNSNTIRFLEINNSTGVTINTPINISSQINLVSGVFTNGSNLSFDNTLGGVSTSTILLQIGAQSSLSTYPTIGLSATYRVTYTFYAGTVNSQQTEGFELPASRTIFSLIINNGLGVVMNGDLNLTNGGTPIALTNGILHMGGNTLRLMLPTANFPAPNSSALSWVDGKTAVTISSNAKVTRNFPVGGTGPGQARTLVIKGLSNDMSFNTIITVEVQNGSSNTDGLNVSDISKARRHFVNVTGNTLLTVDSVKINYGTDDLLNFNPLADRTIANSATAAGPYNSIRSNPNLNSTEIISDQAVPTTLGYFALGVSTGSLPITWVGGPTGDWGIASNWSEGAVPTLSDNVVLNSAIVTLQGGVPPYFGNSLIIGTSGRLNVAANTLQLGPSGGSNRQLVTNGILAISGGSITANGNVLFSSTSSFNLSGGDLIIDGNDGLSSAGSVETGIDLLSFSVSTTGNINASGGKISLIDPPFAGTANSLVINSDAGSGIKSFAGSTLQIGNGISNTTAPAGNGFKINTYAGFEIVPIGNLTVASGSAQGRYLASATSPFDGTHIGGNLVINSNSEARTSDNGAGFTLSGNMTNNGTFTTLTTVLDALTLGNTLGTPSALSPQAVTGTGIFRNSTGLSTANFSSLSVNNTTQVNINTSTFFTGSGTGTVSNNLSLESGILNIGSNILTVGTSTSNIGTVAPDGSGNVNGTLRRFVSISTGIYNFPVGTIIKRLASINFTTAPTSAGSLSITFIKAIPGNTGLPLLQGSIDVNKVADSGYWNVIAADGLAGGTYSPSFTATDFGGINNFATLVLLKRANIASPWVLNGNHITTTGSNVQPLLQRSGVTTGFSQFGVGSDSVGNPLPLKLLNFDGNQSLLSNNLEWITTSEISISGFEVERLSASGKFIKIGQLAAMNKFSEMNQYSFNDNSFDREISQSYYRLKIVSFDQSFEYSRTISIKNDLRKFSATLAPNPSSGNFVFSMNTIKNESINLKLMDITGREILNKTIIADQEILNQEFDQTGLAKGIYFLRFSSGIKSESIKIVVQ